MLRWLEVAAGVALVVLTLRDVFDTVVIPGASHGWLRVAERVRQVTQPGWRRLHRKGPGPPRISRSFASLLLLATFAAWMLLLLLGFSLLAFACGESYRPPVRDYLQAIYAVGSSMVTIGVGQQSPSGPARWIELAAGACGLAVMTLVITYILQVQNGLHSRDAAITKLTVTAGRPPSGVALLETYAALGCREDIAGLFSEWRDWTANTLHRQSTHPALTYFRSMSADMDWPAALGAVLDAATITEALLSHPATGAATLLHREGSRLTAVFVQIFKLEPKDLAPAGQGEVESLIARLAHAGYTIRPDADAERFTALRGDYLSRLTAIADHLGADGLTLT